MKEIVIGICDDLPEAVEELGDILSKGLKEKGYAY